MTGKDAILFLLDGENGCFARCAMGLPARHNVRWQHGTAAYDAPPLGCCAR